MSREKVGCLIVEVNRRIVDFTCEAFGPKLTLAEISPVGGSLREKLRLHTGQTRRRVYEPGTYRVSVIDVDILSILSKTGILPFSIPPFMKFVAAKLAGDPKKPGIKEAIDTHVIAQTVADALMGTETSEIETELLKDVKFVASQGNTTGWFVVEDDYKPPPPPPPRARELDEPKSTYRDSYEEGGFLSRLFKRDGAGV